MYNVNVNEDLKNHKKGELYSHVVATGQRFLVPFFRDILNEFSRKKYPTATHLSYTKIPEYYTIPINRPYIDHGPTDPYARYSTQPRYNTNDQTPEVLLEHFGDTVARSYSTVLDMVDMHASNISFYILNDDHVIEIYEKLDMFLTNFTNREFDKELKDFVDLLNKMLAFKNELYECYYRCCNRKKRTPKQAKSILESIFI